jgi:hypothetical protein
VLAPETIPRTVAEVKALASSKRSSDKSMNRKWRAYTREAVIGRHVVICSVLHEPIPDRSIASTLRNPRHMCMIQFPSNLFNPWSSLIFIRR